MTPIHLPTQIKLKEVLKKLGNPKTGIKGEVWYDLPFFQIERRGQNYSLSSARFNYGGIKIFII